MYCFCIGRIHEGAGLFDNIGGLSVPKTLFPPKLSAPSHGLFEFRFNASKPKIGIGVTPNEPTFEIEQGNSSSTGQPAFEQSSERNSYTKLWISGNSETQQAGLFSTPIAHALVKDESAPQNLSLALATSPGPPHLLPESLNLFNKRDDLGTFHLPTRFFRAACSTDMKQTSLAEQVEQRIPHSATPITVRLSCASPGLNQDVCHWKVFTKFVEIVNIIDQLPASTAFLLSSYPVSYRLLVKLRLSTCRLLRRKRS